MKQSIYQEYFWIIGRVRVQQELLLLSVAVRRIKRSNERRMYFSQAKTKTANTTIKNKAKPKSN